MKTFISYCLRFTLLLFSISAIKTNAQLFLPKTDFTTALLPRSVATGDFNGDNKTDLATANEWGNNVSILLGNGNGTFQNHSDYATGSASRTVAIGDFNGDNKTDLAVANYNDNTVSILLGNGDGTFQNKVDYGVGTSPWSVAVGDFNRDNKSDLAVCNFNSNNVSVLIGNGNGTFQVKVDYVTGVNSRNAAIGDFNGDNKSDLAVPNMGNDNVSILLGNGNGTFQNKVDYGVGRNPSCVSIEDFNGDNKSDLVVTNYGSSNVSRLLGNGDGTFQNKADYGTGTGPNSVAIEDLDGDNKSDIAVTNIGTNNVSILLGNGNGTFQNKVDYATGVGPFTIAIGDFNGDKRFDLAISNQNDNNVTILINLAANRIPTAANGSISINEDNIKTFASSDFNYTDSDNDPMNKIQITSLPISGTLFKDANLNSSVDAGETILLNGEITKAEMDANKLKFLPTLDQNGSPYTTYNFKVYDGTAYSSNSYTMTINVNAVNDAPVLSAVENAALSYTEGDAAIAITSTITVSDVDDTNIESATVQITGNYQNGQDVLSFTSRNGISGTWIAATGTISLSGIASLASYQSALRDVKYENKSQNPSTLQRIITFTVDDGTSISNSTTRNIIVLSINNAPSLAAIEVNQINYSEGDLPVQLTNELSVLDIDNTEIQSATIFISGNYSSGEDRLTFSYSNGITGNWDGATGTLTLNGPSSLANYQSALRDVKYFNTSNHPVTLIRTVSFLVNDGNANSNIMTRDITIASVNSPAILSNIEPEPIEYKIKQSCYFLSKSVVLEDPDDNEINGILIISIDENYQSDEDELVFNNQFGITGQWNSGQGCLYLFGNASASIFQAALRSVSYRNKKIIPNSINRLISISFNDGDNNNEDGKPIFRTIVFVPENIAPVISGFEADTVKYTTSDSRKLVCENISIADSDNLNLQSATVKISGAFIVGEDVLEVSSPQYLHVLSDWAKGTLVVTGQESILGYQNILRTVKYRNLKGDLATTLLKTIEIAVTDGVSVSNHATILLKVQGLISDVKDFKQKIPTENYLSQNYPNPFNPSTSFSYTLPVESRVKLSIFNILGEKLVTLVDEIKPSGNYKVNWDADNLSSGIYLYNIEVVPQNGEKSYIQSKKMTLLK